MHVSKRMFADFEAYWRRLQEAMAEGDPGQRHIPTRRQFNPMSVPKLLPNLYMIQYAGEDDLKVRLTGTAIDEALERPMTNQNMLDLYTGAERDFFKSVHRHIIHRPCGAVLRRYMILSNGKGYELTSKNLPLADETGRTKYIVGMLGADLMHLSPLGEPAVLAGSTITDFYYLDVGFGVPDEEHDWLKTQRAS